MIALGIVTPLSSWKLSMVNEPGAGPGFLSGSACAAPSSAHSASGTRRRARLPREADRWILMGRSFPRARRPRGDRGGDNAGDEGRYRAQRIVQPLPIRVRAQHTVPWTRLPCELVAVKCRELSESSHAS